ncbi:MAG: UDP-2,3-diacylglucosamine diphosphatase [bacterium]
MEKEILFIADAHLKKISNSSQKDLINFFDKIKHNLSCLYILGDLFDFWFGYKSVVFFQYLPILNKLIELHDLGISIFYIEGNHDFNIGPFFKAHLSAQIFPKETELSIDGNRIYLAHGNGLNKKDYGYRLLHILLRSHLINFIIMMLPPDLTWGIASIISKSSRGSSSKKRRERLWQNYIIFSEKKFKEGIDTIILGHIHSPEMHTRSVNGGKKTLITLGAWDSQRSYLLYNRSDGFRLLTYGS